MTAGYYVSLKMCDWTRKTSRVGCCSLSLLQSLYATECLEFAETQKVTELGLAKSSSNLWLMLDPYAQQQSYNADVSSSVSVRRKRQ